MDPTLYKDIETSRGLDYHYYFTPASEGKQTLVFVHGFPSTSYDWRHQAGVAFFKEKGYGLIVPDMLGYGGTAKPTEPSLYKYSLLSRDIVDILDAEKIETAVFIGHDWGAVTTSRIVQYFPERVAAFALLAVGYAPPNPQFDFEKGLAFTKEKVGYELFGYWAFLNEEGSAKICEDNFEKFFNLIFPENPKQWIADLAQRGAFETYITTKPTPPAPSWLTTEEIRVQSEELLKGGLAAPSCYYKCMLKYTNEDDKNIPLERYKTDKPAFFGAALEDYIALAPLGVQQSKALCQNLTVKEFQANHWVQLQRPNEVNKELEAWLGEL